MRSTYERPSIDSKQFWLSSRSPALIHGRGAGRSDRDPSAARLSGPPASVQLPLVGALPSGCRPWPLPWASGGARGGGDRFAPVAPAMPHRSRGLTPDIGADDGQGPYQGPLAAGGCSGRRLRGGDGAFRRSGLPGNNVETSKATHPSLSPRPKFAILCLLNGGGSRHLRDALQNRWLRRVSCLRPLRSRPSHIRKRADSPSVQAGSLRWAVSSASPSGSSGRGVADRAAAAQAGSAALAMAILRITAAAPAVAPADLDCSKGVNSLATRVAALAFCVVL
jgi:hypothetical protein